MFTIALELNIMYQAPFFLTWLTTGLGELLSLLIGAVVIESVMKRIPGYTLIIKNNPSYDCLDCFLFRKLFSKSPKRFNS